MNKSGCEKVYKFIKDNNVFPELNLYDDTDDEISDFLYGDFYLLKKLYEKNDFDLDKIKNSSNLEEYEKNIESECKKLNELNFDIKDWHWKKFYYNRDEIIDFIKSLNLDDFDINYPSYAWFNDTYIKQFIRNRKIKNILSVNTVFYDEELSKRSNIDVIYNVFQGLNIMGHRARLDIYDYNNYNFILGKYPPNFSKKYDLIILDLNYDSIDSLERDSLVKLDENIGGVFDGDNISHHISDLSYHLSLDGMAIIKIPFTFVSKLEDDLIDKNIIDKIIYLPKEHDSFANEICDVKYVYIIVKNDKSNKEIEFVDKTTGKSYAVNNSTIIKNRGCTNFNIYIMHNLLLEKLYKIKEDNSEQLEIITKESKFIDKQIDELDFEQ